MNLSAIKFWCERNYLSIDQLAEKIGSNNQLIYRAIERNDMKASMLEKIAEVLKVPVREFFTDSLSMQVQHWEQENTKLHNEVGLLSMKNTKLTEELKQTKTLLEEYKALVELYKNAKSAP